MKKLNSVLLIDDDNASNYLSRLLIEEMNIVEQVYTAKHGREALDLLEKLRASAGGGHFLPDMILLDVNMPVMSGFEFLEAYHKLSEDAAKHTRVVMLTSSEYRRDIDKARQFGIHEYITKPLTEENLEILFGRPYNGEATE